MSIEITNAQQFISWMDKKAYLNSIASNAARRFVKRGQVFWCHLGLNIGSEMSKVTPRPVVVVSNFNTNRNSSNVVVVPVTHNQGQMPYLVPISPIIDATGNVILDGQADTAGIKCVSKARLGDYITTLSAAQMKAIDESISTSLELIHYYNTEVTKYKKLQQYVVQVKNDRNNAQDKLDKLREIIGQCGFDAEGQRKIREILDMD